MSAGFAADPDRLAGNVGRYISLAGDVTAGYNAVVASLDAVGACWGDDAAGQQFSSNYLPNRDAVLEQWAKVRDAMAGAASGVDGWQYGYRSTEDTLLDGLT